MNGKLYHQDTYITDVIYQITETRDDLVIRTLDQKVSHTPGLYIEGVSLRPAKPNDMFFLTLNSKYPAGEFVLELEDDSKIPITMHRPEGVFQRRSPND